MRLNRRIFIGIGILLSTLHSHEATASCAHTPELDPIQSTLELLSDHLSADERADLIKKDYLSSGMCDPTSSFSGDELSALYFKAAQRYAPDDCNYAKRSPKYTLASFEQQFQLTEAEKWDLRQLLSKCTQKFSDHAYLQFRVKYMQVVKSKLNSKVRPLPGTPWVWRLMSEVGMTRLRPEGTLDCNQEFINPDALKKALTGYAQLKAQHKADQARYLTVVDYTKPSNSRRMYLIDLTHNRIVDQTWVAHGMGRDAQSIVGRDGFGSNPSTSDDPGSKLSSEGFAITQNIYKGKFGSSLRLQGLDARNRHLSDRGIVIHDWERRTLAPTNKSDFKGALHNLDSASSTSDSEMNVILTRITSVDTMPYLMATEGCLGVHPGPARVRDESGAIQEVASGSEFLRSTLSGGSVIFNYSGPDQKSDYY